MTGKELYLRIQQCKRVDGSYNHEVLSLMPLIEKYMEEIEFPMPEDINGKKNID
ncbi:MAG TPA: hypothetical protein P5513_07410 [Candidatus Diapherotrites archaeon]|jgi:hypothetical protein|nr:hypothetical protein [Candidatus Diapherotrites archaeon]